tara:strand:- start:3692 stop:4588 length:897 start_codon:yes stop_codon:yes gene_type:complete
MADMNAQTMMVDGVSFDAETSFMYTKAKVNASGGKSVGILNSSTKKGLYVSTPLMLTWGINEYVDEQTGKRTYDMSLQFPKDEYGSEVLTKFLDNMKAFETKLKNDAIKNSKEWMNKAKMTAEVCDALWTPMLKYPKYPEGHEAAGDFDYSRPPTLRLKVPYWEGEWKVELYDMEQQPLFPNDKGVLPTELVPKQTNIATVIQCGGLWFANGKFGVTWKLFQGVVKPKPSLKGKCLIALSDSDRAVLEKPDDEEVQESSVPVTLEADSDEDEEAEPEPEPEPEPPKKKVVRKKAVAKE